MSTLTIRAQLLSSSYPIPAVGFFDGTKFLLSNFSGWPNCLTNSPSSSPHMSIRSLSIKQTQPYSWRWLLDLHCISPYVSGFSAQKQGPASERHMWKACSTFQTSKPLLRFPRTIPGEECVHGRWCKEVKRAQIHQIQNQTLRPCMQSNELGIFLNY